MYWSLFLLLISFLFWGCSFDSTQKPIQSDDFHIFEAKDGFRIDFYSGRTTARQIQSQNGWVVLNGSYFWLLKSGVIYPAGLWIENKATLFPLDISDPNLGYVVSYTSYKNTLEIRKNSESKDQIDSCIFTSSECFAFQAWPLVLSGNILQDFWESWHAYGKYERTLIWKTKSGKIFFFVFPKKISLTDVAQDILWNVLFQKDPLTLLNLDGWPSTSYMDARSYVHPDEKLPIFISIP